MAFCSSVIPSLMNDFFQDSKLDTSSILSETTLMWLTTPPAGAAGAADKAAAPAAPAGGVVSHIKVVSDKIEDVSSFESWKKSFIKDGMTDEQKAMAIWTTVVKFRHQDSPPYECL